MTADESAGTLTLTAAPKARVQDWATAREEEAEPDATPDEEEEEEEEEPWPPPTVVHMVGRDLAQVSF